MLQFGLSMKYIAQRTNYDCGIASLAMLSDKSYEEIYEYYLKRICGYVITDTLSKGMRDWWIRDYMEDIGYEIIYDPNHWTERGHKVFAERHHVIVRVHEGSPLHSVVMDFKGNFFDVGRGSSPKTVNDFHQIFVVQGYSKKNVRNTNLCYQG